MVVMQLLKLEEFLFSGPNLYLVCNILDYTAAHTFLFLKKSPSIVFQPIFTSPRLIASKSLLEHLVKTLDKPPKHIARCM